MNRSIQLTVLASALAVWALSAVQSHGQGLDLCPRPGTMFNGRNTTGDYSVTTKGADPKDSSVCISVAVGPGTGINNGKPVGRIYGWYDVTNYNLSSDTQTKARAGLGAVLSGQSTEATFDMTRNEVNRFRTWSGVESWKRTGQTTISSGGRSLNVITLHESFKGGANSRYDAAWDLWYDPALHLFVKGHLTSESGFAGRVRDYEIVSWTAP